LTHTLSRFRTESVLRSAKALEGKVATMAKYKGSRLFSYSAGQRLGFYASPKKNIYL